MRKQRNEGKLELTLIDTSFLDISNRSLLNNVPHQEPLDGLVLFHHQHEIKTNQSHIYKMHIRIDTQTCMYVCMYTHTLGQHLPQLEQRMNLTCPRPCLLRPPFRRLKVCRENKKTIIKQKENREQKDGEDSG